MADMKSAIRFLTDYAKEVGETNPVVGIDNYRPYYRATDGTLYGVLFGENHAGDPQWERGPKAIIKFPAGVLSSRNWEVIKWLCPPGGTGQAQ